MEDIKQLIKKAKKEEKKNPEFLYQLGLRFKNGEGVEANYGKAYKYFTKAADMGHIQGQVETAICWWKYYHSYYYANLYFLKAIEQGSEEAKQLLEQMQQEKTSKKSVKTPNDNLIHCNGEKGVDLCETPKFKDDEYTSFYKKHTLVCCPACRGKIEVVSHNIEGQLTKDVVMVFDKDSIFERRSDPYLKPTSQGQTLTQEYECKNCKLKFTKTTHTLYIEKDKPEKFKEMMTINMFKK